jgi:hypothetical protein
MRVYLAAVSARAHFESGLNRKQSPRIDEACAFWFPLIVRIGTQVSDHQAAEDFILVHSSRVCTPRTMLYVVDSSTLKECAHGCTSIYMDLSSKNGKLSLSKE